MFDRPYQLFQYLANVPGQPTELSLRHVGCQIHGDIYADSGYSGPLNIVSELPSSRWQLTSLDLDATEFRKDLLSWLLSPAIDLTGLQSPVITAVNGLAAVFNGIELPAPTLFEQLVIATGPSVRKLTLGMDWPTDPSTTNQFTAEAMKQFTTLEQLIVLSDHHSRHGLSQMLCVLPGLDGNTSLTEIILAITDMTGHKFETIDSWEGWDNLDRELDRATLPGFRRFVIVVVVKVVGFLAPLFFKNLENLVRAQMPRLLARGLLEVSVEEWQWKPSTEKSYHLRSYHIHDLSYDDPRHLFW